MRILVVYKEVSACIGGCHVEESKRLGQMFLLFKEGRKTAESTVKSTGSQRDK